MRVASKYRTPKFLFERSGLRSLWLSGHFNGLNYQSLPRLAGSFPSKSEAHLPNASSEPSVKNLNLDAGLNRSSNERSPCVYC